ncbi:MAG: glycoside hydrolase family 78 protein [Verrucomicrobiota bacterium]
MIRSTLTLLALCAASFHTLSAGTPYAGTLSPTKLRCEYLENPLGIDVLQPRLTWIHTSDERGAKQTAYQILVASSESAMEKGQADLWDSGKIASDETSQIRYSGKPLDSRQQAVWKVRVWDGKGQVSESKPATWEMGLLKPDAWSAKWIARTTDTNSNPAPLLRRTFNLDGKIKQARAYICGLGYYELYLNDGKIGDHVLDPGYTRYDRRALYVTYDVTDQLKQGANAIGVILGNGWYNCHTKAGWKFHEAPWRAAPKLLLHLRVDYVDGRSETIVSDESWKCSTGPIVFDSIYGGETYDARLEKSGWAHPEYNAADWEPVKIVDAPSGQLAAQMMPPIKIDLTLKPAKLTEPKPGVFVFDIGQNLAGMAELTVSGPAGTRVQMRYGERLSPDGSLDTRDIEQHVKKLGKEQQHQTDTYILKGAGKETWHSRFTYHGFQYVEVTGFPGNPTLDNLRALFIHSAVPKAGDFTCSNPMLEKINTAAHWSFLSNLQGIPTDCPHREKNGWTGDAHLACEQAQFNFLPVTVYQKWINDIGDEQKPTGQLPGIVPTSGWGYSWGNGPAWDSAFLLIPYYQYLYYGDTENFRRHYDSMKRYVDYLTTRAKDGIVSIGLNDWAPWKTRTPAGITDTAYYYVDAKIVAFAAGLLDNKDDARKYEALAESIRTAFNVKFYHPETALYDNGGQTALSCALYQGLVAPENKARVMENLVAAVEKTNNHIDAGILGTKYILNALLENGRADVAYRMVAQKDQPGWGWWLEQGGTTLWEQWSGGESRNHIMFGDVSAWFYKALAGIQPDPQSPGFKHFFISPQVVGDLTRARGEYDSIRGRIVSDWQVVNGEFHITLIIPANTTATVSLPVTGKLSESGQPAAKTAGLTRLRVESGHMVFEVGSGTYNLRGKLSR